MELQIVINMIYSFIQNENIITITVNGKGLGEIIQLEDGTWCWFPPEFKGACLTDYVLKEILQKLEELNSLNS